MGIDVGKNTSAALEIKVGVIDTGCRAHRDLAHVTLVGAFVDGKVLPPAQARDVAEGDGTHTTGIIGARPTKAADYAGMAARAANCFAPASSKAKDRRTGRRRPTSSMPSIRCPAIVSVI